MVGKPCAQAPFTNNNVMMAAKAAAARTNENMTPPDACYPGRDCSPHGAKRNAGRRTRGYPWRSFSARITSMKASVTAEEPISGQSGSAAP